MSALYHAPTPRRSPRPQPRNVLDIFGKLEKVRSGAADLRQRIKCGLTGRLIAEARAERQHEDRRIVLGRASRVRDGDGFTNDAQAVVGDAGQDMVGVLDGQVEFRWRNTIRLPSRGSGNA